MKQIPTLDKQIENRKSTDHPSVVSGYMTARDRGLDLMILGESGLFPDEIPAIVESLRRHGIEKVALTGSSSALMGMLWEFTKAGATFTMAEMIDTGEAGFYGNAQRFVPGFIITLD